MTTLADTWAIAAAAAARGKTAAADYLDRLAGIQPALKIWVRIDRVLAAGARAALRDDNWPAWANIPRGPRYIDILREAAGRRGWEICLVHTAFLEPRSVTEYHAERRVVAPVEFQQALAAVHQEVEREFPVAYHQIENEPLSGAATAVYSAAEYRDLIDWCVPRVRALGAKPIVLDTPADPTGALEGVHFPWGREFTESQMLSAVRAVVESGRVVDEHWVARDGTGVHGADAAPSYGLATAASVEHGARFAALFLGSEETPERQEWLRGRYDSCVITKGGETRAARALEARLAELVGGDDGEVEPPDPEPPSGPNNRRARRKARRAHALIKAARQATKDAEARNYLRWARDRALQAAGRLGELA